MSICQSCGGVIGQDCFNPEECAWITQQQANQVQSYHYDAQEAQHSLQQLKAEIAALITEFESIHQTAYLVPGHRDIINKLRQLSAV